MNSENQPGVTRYLTSTPVAAGAKAVMATYLHTVVVAQRDDCKMVRRRVPGFALVRSTGDPAFRFRCSKSKKDDGLEDSTKFSRVCGKASCGITKKVVRIRVRTTFVKNFLVNL